MVESRDLCRQILQHPEKPMEISAMCIRPLILSLVLSVFKDRVSLTDHCTWGDPET